MTKARVRRFYFSDTGMWIVGCQTQINSGRIYERVPAFIHVYIYIYIYISTTAREQATPNACDVHRGQQTATEQTNIYLPISLSLSIYIYIYMYVTCIYLSIYLSISLSLSIYMYVYIYIYIYIYTITEETNRWLYTSSEDRPAARRTRVDIPARAAGFPRARLLHIP